MIVECQIKCECDECGEIEDFEVSTATIGFDVLSLRLTLKQSGWKVEMTAGGYRMTCLDCNGG